MKVFVVFADLDLDGYGRPERVFSSRQLAEEYCNVQAKSWLSRDIEELEVDAMGDGNAQT